MVIHSTWAILVIFLMRMVSPIILIRLCEINAVRIGHFVPDIAEHLARIRLRQSRKVNVYWFRNASNQQWEKMARRSALFVAKSWVKYIYRWNEIIPGGKKHFLKSSMTNSRDIEGLFQKYDCSIPFLENENVKCRNWLQQRGWIIGEPFVVLHVRDSAYLERELPDFSWSYHDYRNSELRTYFQAIEWLVSNGVWVIRMGKVMAQPMHLRSDKVIDYPFESDKSDLLDIWLFANSSGIISTSSGLDCLGGVYRVPILFLNAMPIFDFATYYDCIWVPKHLKWQKSNNELTLKETLQNTFYDSQQYVINGIEIIDLDESEILGAVKEFWQKINGTFCYSPWETEQQGKFLRILMEFDEHQQSHGFIHPNASVGSSWLSERTKAYLN